MHLTIRIADEPCSMPISVQPIDLQTSPILLAAPAAAALYVENVHVDPTARRRQSILGSCGPFFENVIVDCVYSPKRFSGHIRIWNTDAECLFHAHNQFQRVDGIKA